MNFLTGNFKVNFVIYTVMGVKLPFQPYITHIYNFLNKGAFFEVVYKFIVRPVTGVIYAGTYASLIQAII